MPKIYGFQSIEKGPPLFGCGAMSQTHYQLLMSVGCRRIGTLSGTPCRERGPDLFTVPNGPRTSGPTDLTALKPHPHYRIYDR